MNCAISQQDFGLYPINMGNYTMFYLNAFSENTRHKTLLFVLFLMLYLITVIANMFIIVLTKIDDNLQTPMYFFLKNLSFLDICYTSTTLPKMLASILIEHDAITFTACLVQLYFFLSLAASESSILATMAIDRYVAICIPLQYSIIMSENACLIMVIGTWVVGLIYGAIHTTNTFRLPFCGSKVINHYFCDIPPLLKISCINTFINELTVFAVGGILMMGCFCIIFGSYMRILLSVLRIPKSGRTKTFSTCVSHLIVVLLFYGSGCFMYMRPKSNLLAEKGWLLSLFYTSITPLLNPIIYSLRNKDIKKSIQKLCNQILSQKTYLGAHN